MAHVLAEQLAKIEMDMAKAGYPKSAIYLALYNECKKYAVMGKAAEYHYLYLKYRDIENQEQAKDNQPQAYQSLSYADVSPDLYNQEAQKAQQQQVAASMMGMLGDKFYAGLVGDKFYGKGLAELIKGQEPSSSIEFQQSVLNQFKKGWGGGSDKAPPPAPKPKQVDSVPDHGGARRFRHEDD